MSGYGRLMERKPEHGDTPVFGVATCSLFQQPPAEVPVPEPVPQHQSIIGQLIPDHSKLLQESDMLVARSEQKQEQKAKREREDKDLGRPAKRRRVLIPEWAAPKPTKSSSAFWDFTSWMLSYVFVPESALSLFRSSKKSVSAIKNDPSKKSPQQLTGEMLSSFGDSAAVGVWGPTGKMLRESFSHTLGEKRVSCENAANSMALTIPHQMQRDKTITEYVEAESKSLARPPVPIDEGAGDDVPTGMGVLRHLGLAYTISGPLLRLYDCTDDQAKNRVVPLRMPSEVKAVADVRVYAPLSFKTNVLLLVITNEKLHLVALQSKNHVIRPEDVSTGVGLPGVSSVVTTEKGNVFVGFESKSAIFEVKVGDHVRDDGAVEWGVDWIREAQLTKKKGILDYFTSPLRSEDGCRRLFVDDSRNMLYMLTKGGAIAVFGYNAGSTPNSSALLTPITVLSDFSRRVKSVFADSRPRCKEMVPEGIDRIFELFEQRNSGRVADWKLRHARRSPALKWDLVNKFPYYCPPLVASVIVVPSTECPYASLVVVLNSGHRIIFNPRYDVEQVCAAPSSLRQGMDVVVDAAGMRGCVVMQYVCFEDDSQGSLMIYRTYRGSQFVEEYSTLSKEKWVGPLKVSCFDVPSPLDLCSSIPPLPGGAAAASTQTITTPSNVLSCGITDPKLTFFLQSGKSITRRDVVRPVDTLLSIAQIPNASVVSERMNTFFGKYPPIIAGAIAFEAFLEDYYINGARKSGNRDAIKWAAKVSPRLDKREEFCSQFGTLRSFIESQTLALNRMLNAVLALRCFNCYYDGNHSCNLKPALSREHLAALRMLLSRVETGTLAYNDIDPNAINQEKLLKQFDALCDRIRSELLFSGGRGLCFSSPEEQNYMSVYALLCRRLEQIVVLLELLSVENEKSESWESLYSLPEEDLTWLRSCTMNDMALTERGNAVVAKIVNALVDFVTIKQIVKPCDFYQQLQRNLSLFFTRDSEKIFVVKEKLDRLQKLQQAGLVSADSHEVQDIVQGIVQALLSCNPLEYSDLNMVFRILCRSQCFKQAITVVMDNCKRVDLKGLTPVVSMVSSRSSKDSSQSQGNKSTCVPSAPGDERGKCYELVLSLFEERSKDVRKDSALPIDAGEPTVAEERFCEFLELATSGTEDEQWLDQLLQWLATKEFTHLIPRISSPYVVRFLEKNPRRDVLLPRYYQLRHDLFNSARAFYEAATSPTMPCTLEQREGNLLVAQRFIKECSMLKSSVASLSTSIDSALSNLRFQQRVRASIFELSMAAPNSVEKTAVINKELTANIYPVQALVDAYVRPFGLTELELMSLQYSPNQQDVTEQARMLWRRLINERIPDGTLSTARLDFFLNLHAQLPPRLFPLDEIILILEEQHAFEFSDRTKEGVQPGERRCITFNMLDTLVNPAYILLNSRVKHCDLFLEYSQLCTRVQGTAKSIDMFLAHCACMYSLLYVVQDWLRVLNEAFSTPSFAEDITNAISILQLTSEKVSSAVRQCYRNAEEIAQERPELAEVCTQLANQCCIATDRVSDLRACESHKIALRFQRVPQANWAPVTSDLFSTPLTFQ